MLVLIHEFHLSARPTRRDFWGGRGLGEDWHLANMRLIAYSTAGLICLCGREVLTATSLSRNRIFPGCCAVISLSVPPLRYLPPLWERRRWPWSFSVDVSGGEGMDCCQDRSSEFGPLRRFSPASLILEDAIFFVTSINVMLRYWNFQGRKSSPMPTFGYISNRKIFGVFHI